MNILAILFSALAIFIFFFGILVNYFAHLIPEKIVELFVYGRASINKHGSSILQHVELPKSWFGHFYLYAVVLQATVLYTVVTKYYYLDESSNWLSKILIFLGGTHRPTTVTSTSTVIAVVLLMFHLSRRLLETWYVCIYSGTKMNVLHYVLAFIHYTSAILALVASSPGFSSDLSAKEDYIISSKHITFEVLFGFYLFLYGNYHQFLAHKGLADLRRGSDKSVSTMEHKIPRGGLFESVSCPNYWAEIVIYVGFTFILGCKDYTWNCCTVWVIANQISAGVMNHHWYQTKFKETYPQSRKAVIPYIW